MKTIAYLRVRRARRTWRIRRYEILEYAQRNKMLIDDFVEIEISTRKDRDKRRIDEVLSMLRPHDTLLVSELSRIGRSTGEVINIIDELIQKKVKFVAINRAGLWTAKTT